MAETRNFAPSYGSGATGIKEKAAELAHEAKEKVGDMAGQAKEKLRDWTTAAGEKVDDAREAVGSGVESVGEKIREAGPKSGVMSSATHSLANSMGSAGAYLREHDFGDMGEDATNLIRRHPIPSVLVALGLGFLAARALRN